jgi:predicted amidophosphoribosyltransferase
MKEKCLDVLYPPRCPACGGILEDKQRSICPQCESIFHPVSEYYCMKCGKPVNETEEYCSECKRYDEIQKLQNDMKKIQEARNCFKECADRDYNMM